MYIIVTGMAIYFIYKDKVPLAWDQSGYMTVVAQIGHALQKFQLYSVFKLFIHHNVWPNRPALFMLVGGIFASVTNFNINLIIILSNMFWVAILIYFTYKLSEYLLSNTGVLSVFMLISSSCVVSFYREFLIELPLAACIVMVQYLYFKSDKLLSQKWCYLLLSSFVIASLIKETCILYIFPLFVFSSYRLIFLPEYKTKAAKSNYFLVYGGSLLIVFLFYFPIFSPLLRNMFDNIGEAVGHAYARPYAKNSLDYYLVYFYGLFAITSFFYIIFPGVLLLIKLLKSKSISLVIKKNNIEILSLILFPIIILTICVTDTDTRFIMPILPIVLISSSIVINKNVFLVRNIVILLIVLIGTCSLITSMYPLKFIPATINIGRISVFQQSYYNSGLRSIREGFVGIDLNYVKIIQDVGILFNDKCNNKCRVGVLTATPQLNEPVFTSYAALQELPVRYEGFTSISSLNSFGYVITSIGDINFDPKVASQKINNVNSYIFAQVKNEHYQIIKKYLLPDGRDLFIIKTQPIK